MRYRFTFLVLVAGLLAGCMEGQKPKPLSRAGKSNSNDEVAVKPEKSAPEVPAKPMPPEKPAKPSLYQRLGMEPAIVAVVDDFVANVVADPDIKEKHKKHFQEGDVAGLKKKL